MATSLKATKKFVYLCGPTVYADVHVGNLRPIVTLDIVLRAWRFLQKEYVFIHNITDIDDKIIEKSARESKTEKEVAGFYTRKYNQILKSFNVVKPTLMPNVVSNMKVITDFIQNLLDKGFAFEKNGEVFFDVTKTKTYGTLANRQPEKAFYLWKKTRRGITFLSPWGRGRPGWHTECAALVDHYTNGRSLAVHAGGSDLLFPHHENENAQYEAKNNVAITKRWVHVGKLSTGGEKMSKSLNNVLLAKDFLSNYEPNILRLVFLNASVTKPLDLTKELITQNQTLLAKIKSVFYACQLVNKHVFKTTLLEQNNNVLNFAVSLADFNFAKAMQIFSNQTRVFNIEKTAANATSIVQMVKLFGLETSRWVLNAEDFQNLTTWQNLVAQKDFEKADDIRKTLVKKGII